MMDELRRKALVDHFVFVLFVCVYVVISSAEIMRKKQVSCCIISMFLLFIASSSSDRLIDLNDVKLEVEAKKEADEKARVAGQVVYHSHYHTYQTSLWFYFVVRSDQPTQPIHPIHPIPSHAAHLTIQSNRRLSNNPNRRRQKRNVKPK
jgi:hypothetical protein